MGCKVILELEGLQLRGELGDGAPARALADRLPLAVSVARWGEEYYGSLGAPLGRFSGPTAEELAVGDLAWWEPGNALCLFFGPTPASRGREFRAASPVHPLGRVTGDWDAVRALGGTVRARLRAEAP